MIVNCDNCSADGTRESFLSTPTTTPKIYVSTPCGVTGKGHNLRNLFEKAVEMSAAAVAVIDADVKGVAPQMDSQPGRTTFRGLRLRTHRCTCATNTKER